MIVKIPNIFLILVILFTATCASVTHKKYEGKKFRISVVSAKVHDLELNEMEVLQEIQSVLSESFAFDIYDRRRLEYILKEKDLTLTGLVEESNFSRIGDFAGIDGVVTVHSNFSGDSAFFTIQLFNTKNAEILSSVSFSTFKNNKQLIYSKFKEYSMILSNQFIDRINFKKGNRSRAGVVLLEDIDKKPESRNISEWIPILESGLVKNYNLSIISRKELEFIIKTQTRERGLSLQGLLKSENFNEIGNISGVEYILLGSLNSVSSGCARKFNLQAINTKTALTKNAESIGTRTMDDGLMKLASSMTERITLPKEDWTTHYTGDSYCSTNFWDSDIDLIKAARDGNLNVISDAHKKGLDLNVRDENGNTPLHIASEKGHSNLVDYLKEKGGDIHAKDNQGKTPLHLASEKGHISVVDLLKSKGADIHAKDNLGKTPLHLATEKGHGSLVEYLKEKGADVHAKDNQGKTALHIASEHGHSPLVDYLKSKGADMHAKDHNGKTPLHLASEKGHHSIVDYLKDKGADVNSKDHSGKTPLHLATEKGHSKVMDSLKLKKEK